MFQLIGLALELAAGPLRFLALLVGLLLYRWRAGGRACGGRLAGRLLGQGREVVVVVAFVRRHLILGHRQDVGGHLVDKVPVMGDKQHGPRELINCRFQDFPTVNVQVVGRFIENQVVDRFKGELG